MNMKKTKNKLNILAIAVALLIAGARTNHAYAQPYQDLDGDGYGSTVTDPGGVSNNLDCDDNCALCFPGSPEIADGLDNDCNGLIDDGLMSVNVGADASSLFGYSAGQDISRTATITGGYPPFTYTWTLDRALICNYFNSSGDELFYGGTCANTVCPGTGSLSVSPSCNGATINTRLLASATVCLTVTDAQNTTASDCFVIFAEDARCHSGNTSKVNVCHSTGSSSNPWVQICISENALPAHLAHNSGDYVGICDPRMAGKVIVEGNDFAVYPNPSSGLFNIQYNSGTNSPLNIRIDNIYGQVVYSETISNFTGTLDKALDLSSLSDGMYTVTLKDGSNFKSHRLVLTK